MIRRLHVLLSSQAAVLALACVAAAGMIPAAFGASAVLIGLLAVCLTVALAVIGRLRAGPVLDLVASVVLLTCLISLVEHHRADVPSVLLVGIGVVACLLDEPLARRVVPAVRAVQLPGVPDDPRPQTTGPLFRAVVTALGLAGVLTTLKGVWVAPVSVGSAALVAMLLVLATACRRLLHTVRERRAGRGDRAITRALEAFGPQFYVYFSGPVEGEYQIRMWLPHLAKLGVPFAVLTRDPRLLPRARTLADVPVVASRRLGTLDAVMVPSVRAVFYVNTHMMCVDGVRYLDRTHVHLNHGDSDKPSSYHPMISMFDQVFLAGQAAVDRFERHGVHLPAEKVRLVGRPQIADIAVREPARRGDEDLPLVLYAPTWRGGVRDMNLSSLDRGERIVGALLEAGARVAFRPHPLSVRDKSSRMTIEAIDELLAADALRGEHLGSADATSRNLTDLFNESDALVTDVSSVATDYLRADKPMAVVDIGGQGLSLDPDIYPILAAVSVLALEGDLAQEMSTMLEQDPAAMRRKAARTYFLGDSAGGADIFTEAARSAINGARSASESQ